MIRSALQRWPLLVVHFGIVLLMLPGLMQRTGAHYLLWVAVYLTCVLVAYMLAMRIPLEKLRLPWPDLGIQLLAYGMPLVTIIFAVVHWRVLGHVPLLEALKQDDDLAVVALRREANEVPAWINYGGQLVLKALLPFGSLVLWYRKRWAFWSAAILGLVYSMSLLQKSPVITPFVPLWVSFVIFRKWRSFISLSAIMVTLLAFLVMVANPVDEATPTRPRDEGYGHVGRIVISLGSRIFLTPGWTLAAWFTHIPQDIPFQEGGAIRPLAAVLGVPYRDLSREVYDLEYPELAALNTQGTMASASFMYGWANFGGAGIAMEGLIMGVWLVLVNVLFKDRWRWACCLCVFPLLSASATSLPTVLLTHGWLATLVLFWLFIPPDSELEE
ncbi:MAG: hypothetical protein IPP83_05740 [Flavobacteriales bacterium]|nr:hypothetical protein [Flavobacteriales bacterium]